jgi:hypothetical protein
VPLLYTSCSKSEEERNSKLGSFENNRHQKSNSASTSFESFGIEHNLFLDYISEMPDFNTKTGKDIFDWGSLYNFQVLTNSAMQNNWSEFQAAYAYNESILAKSPNSAVMQLVTDQRISRDFYFTALEIFETLTKSNDLADFHSRLDKIEANIHNKYKVVYNENTFEGNEAALFLGAVAIARASGQYWNDVESDPTHKWHTKLMNLSHNPSDNSPAINSLRLPRWIRAAGKDIGAFFTSGHCWVPNQDPFTPPGPNYTWQVDCSFDYASRMSAAVE